LMLPLAAEPGTGFVTATVSACLWDDEERRLGIFKTYDSVSTLSIRPPF
jgi:hypothetical protein